MIQTVWQWHLGTGKGDSTVEEARTARLCQGHSRADGTELWRRENLTSPGPASQFTDPGRKEMPEVGCGSKTRTQGSFPSSYFSTPPTPIFSLHHHPSGCFPHRLPSASEYPFHVYFTSIRSCGVEGVFWFCCCFL